MLPRILAISLTVLLVATQVAATTELGDVTAEHEHEDEVVAYVHVTTVAAPAARAACAPSDIAVPPPPAVARVFRPPRPLV